MKKLFLYTAFVLATLNLFSQEKSTAKKFELLPLGDMNTWMPRLVKESGIIGGNERLFYEIAKGDTLKNEPYQNQTSPWATSSVLAKVKGITKASYTVFPEKRGDGYAARMETRIEGVKVLGIISINVLASGTVFLGEMVEPITNTDNPLSKLNAGIPFTKSPDALQFDYKVTAGGKSIRSTGFSGQKQLDVKDKAEVTLYLQHRFEDNEGNIYAKRVATAWEDFDKTVPEWQNKHQLTLNYGDISQKAYFNDKMALKNTDDTRNYARNSKGVMMPIREIGWATKDELPTHLILQFSSSNGGPYIGSIDNRFWIDNVGFVY